MLKCKRQDSSDGRAGECVHLLVGLDWDTYVRVAMLARCKRKSIETMIQKMIGNGLTTEVTEMAERE
jgi:hypothetical protein